MQVASYDRYGGPEVVQLRTAPTPVPGKGEVLVRVRAAALNPKDIIVQSGRLALYRLLAGRRFPKSLGYDWSGEAVSFGPGAYDLAVGDALYGMIDSWGAGACATHVVVSRKELARKPAALSWEEAAAIPLAAQTALQALRDIGQVRAGGRVLINGASGGVGTFAVQIAKALGAHVTTVTSRRNLDLVKSIGADDALDYESGPPRATSGRFDVFFDVFGNKSFGFAQPLLTDDGFYVSTVPKPHLMRAMVTTLLRRQRARLVTVRSRSSDLVTLTGLVDGGVVKPIVDSIHPLQEIVAAEVRVASRRARGKVVLSVASSDAT